MVPPLFLSRRRQFHYLAPATYTVESAERKGNSITSARRRLDIGQVAVKTREIGKSLLIAGWFCAGNGPTAGQRITQTGEVMRQFRLEPHDFAG